jgi:hypothetical protein
MKRTSLVALLAATVLLAVTGCDGLDKLLYANADTNQPSATVEAIDSVAEGVATATAPATGGLSLLIYAVGSTLLGAAGTINRAWLAHQRGKALREVDRAPGTPEAAAQVRDPKLKKVVQQAVSG